MCFELSEHLPAALIDIDGSAEPLNGYLVPIVRLGKIVSLIIHLSTVGPDATRAKAPSA
jgi:hypothetical protein